MKGGANVHLSYVYVVLTPNIVKTHPPFLDYLKSKTSDMENNIGNQQYKTTQLAKFDSIVKLYDVIIVVKYNIAQKIYETSSLVDKKINVCPLFSEPESLAILGSALVLFKPLEESTVVKPDIRETLLHHPVTIPEIRQGPTNATLPSLHTSKIEVRFISIHRRKINVANYHREKTHVHFTTVGEDNVQNSVLVGEYANTLLWVIYFACSRELFNPDGIPILFIINNTPYKNEVTTYLKSLQFNEKDEKFFTKYTNTKPRVIPTTIVPTICPIPCPPIIKTTPILLDLHTLNYLRLLCYTSPTSAISNHVVYSGLNKSRKLFGRTFAQIQTTKAKNVENAIIEYGGNFKIIRHGEMITVSIDHVQSDMWERWMPPPVAPVATPITPQEPTSFFVRELPDGSLVKSIAPAVAPAVAPAWPVPPAWLMPTAVGAPSAWVDPSKGAWEGFNPFTTNTSYSFHTHPVSSYESHNVLIGPPSSGDWRGFWNIRNSNTNQNSFHLVSALEGIYILNINIENMSQTLKDAIDQGQERFFLRFEYLFRLRETTFWSLSADEKEQFDQRIVTQSILNYKAWFNATIHYLHEELMAAGFTHAEMGSHLSTFFKVHYLSWKDALHPFNVNGRIYHEINPPFVLQGNIEPNEPNGGVFERVYEEDVLQSARDAHNAFEHGDFEGYYAKESSDYDKKNLAYERYREEHGGRKRSKRRRYRKFSRKV